MSAEGLSTDDKPDIEDEDPPNSSEDEDSSDEVGVSEMDRYWPPPMAESVEITCSHSKKTITAFTINNTGTRFAAGGHDHEVRIWDFEVLDKKRPMSINNVQPCGQTIIKQLDFTNDDEQILVISGSCQAVIIAKDGTSNSKNICSKGDQYITDMSNTRGHVQMLNDGCWNPKDKNSFITCSNDSTIRIWDSHRLDQQKTVIKTRSPANGLKNVPNVCKFSRDALTIVAGCNDGSILMWDTRRKFISTSSYIKNAHLKGSEITGIDYSYGMNKLCTRSEDESCKIWDLRQLRQPLATRTGLTTLYSNTDCCFSPDDKYILTGTSSTKQERGQLHFLETTNLTTQNCVETTEDQTTSSVVRVRWHPKINHIGYSCSNGALVLAYDERRSIGGLQASSASVQPGRGTKRKKYLSRFANSSGGGGATNEVSIPTKIITPHALPLFRDDQSSKSFAKIRQDPKRSYKPEVPLSASSGGGGGGGGAVLAKPAGSTLSSYIARNIARPADDGSMSIRDRILRHAVVAAAEQLPGDGDVVAVGNNGGGNAGGGGAAAGGADGRTTTLGSSSDGPRRRQQQQQQQHGQGGKEAS